MTSQRSVGGHGQVVPNTKWKKVTEENVLSVFPDKGPTGRMSKSESWNYGLFSFLVYCVFPLPCNKDVFLWQYGVLPWEFTKPQLQHQPARVLSAWALHSLLRESCCNPPAPLRSFWEWSLTGTSHEENGEAHPGKDCSFSRISRMLQPGTEIAHFDPALSSQRRKEESKGQKENGRRGSSEHGEHERAQALESFTPGLKSRHHALPAVWPQGQ